MAITAQLIGSLGGTQLEAIPVSKGRMTGAGAVHNLMTVTVPAGERRLVLVDGTMTHGETLANYSPHLQVGSISTAGFKSGPATAGAVVTADTAISVVTNHYSGSRTVEFTGTVYIVDPD